ncbi:MAG: DUF2505 domain-containing protein [Gammaproteobacteria bacterium]|nr:MAG: DUF2505 domain-containing protein [Gammaproteobacteria bacterium]
MATHCYNKIGSTARMTGRPGQPQRSETPLHSAYETRKMDMTEIQQTHPFNCPTFHLIRQFFDPEVLKARTEYLGARDLTISRNQFDGESGVLVFSRDLPAPSDIPAALKRFQRPWNRVDYTETWKRDGDAHFRGEVQAQIHGVPVSVRTHFHLEALTEETCVNHIRVQFESGIPLLGKLLEKVASQDTDQQLQAEYRFFQALLSPETA